MVLKTLLDCEIEFCFYNSFALMSFLLMISRPQYLTKNLHFHKFVFCKIVRTISSRVLFTSYYILNNKKDADRSLRQHFVLAGVLGLEPRSTVLETGALPLNYTPVERKTRFELATPSLARRCSTTELFPQMATRMGLEPTTSAVTGRHSNQLNHRAIRHLSVCLTVIYITIKVLVWQVFFAKNFTKS